MPLRIFALSLLLLAVPAAASDGRIEINQTCALAGGCVPGDAPGFPVTIPGEQSYVLTSSLEVTGGVSAIASNSRGITLDLNGFTIEGDYTCNVNPPNCIVRGSPIIDLAGWHATVRNGNVRNSSGIFVNLGFFGRAENLNVYFGGSDGIVTGAGSLVLDNQVGSVAGDAIQMSFNPEIAGDGRVEGNLIRSVRGDGIDISQGLVLRNYVSSAFLQDGRFQASSAAYGLNRFDSAPSGGTSLGNNLCGGAIC